MDKEQNQLIPTKISIELDEGRALLALTAISKTINEAVNISPEDLPLWYSLLDTFLVATNCPTKNSEHFLRHLDFYLEGVQIIKIHS